MSPLTCTPWKTHAELLQVRHEIYQLDNKDEGKDLRRHAIDCIGSWKARQNAIPHTIESTACLTDAMLHHDIEKNSAFCIRAVYSAAFSRFVTGFCDIGQDAKVKKNMFDVAAAIQMPAPFVQLRHEITHGDMPAVKVLMQHTQAALIWLWQHYWSKIGHNHANLALGHDQSIVVGASAVKERIEPILHGFLRVRRKEIQCSLSSDIEPNQAARTACTELVRLCRGRRQNLRILADCLVKEKVMLPAFRGSADSMEGAFMLWDHLLCGLMNHQRLFVSCLLEQMMCQLKGASTLNAALEGFQGGISAWIAHFYSSGAWKGPRVWGSLGSMRGQVANECIATSAHASSPTWRKQILDSLMATGDSAFKRRYEAFMS